MTNEIDPCDPKFVPYDRFPDSNVFLGAQFDKMLEGSQMTNEELSDAYGIYLKSSYDFFHIVMERYHEIWNSIELEDTGKVGAVLANHPTTHKQGWLSVEDQKKLIDVNHVKEHILAFLKWKKSKNE